jgi:hypothetical protein
VRFSGARSAPGFRLEIPDTLGERPQLTLGVLGVVAPVAVWLIGRLPNDRRAGALRVLVVRVDVVDVHVHLRVAPAGPLRALEIAARRAHEEDVVTESHLGMVHAPVLTCVPQHFLEAEGVGQPVECGRDVLVEEVRRYPRDAAEASCVGCSGAEARRKAS